MPYLRRLQKLVAQMNDFTAGIMIFIGLVLAMGETDTASAAPTVALVGLLLVLVGGWMLKGRSHG